MDIRKYFKPVTEDKNRRTFKLDDASWIEQGYLPEDIEFDFDDIWRLHPPEVGKVMMFDRLVDTPRYSQCYMRPYEFSGVKHNALSLPVELVPFLEWANRDDEKYNQVFVNWYRNGLDYIGPHTDKEREHVPNSSILSISLGAEERVFRVRDKTSKEIVMDIGMPNRSYLVMCGDIQENYTHEVPKTKKSGIGRRINITLRKFLS